LFTVLSIGVSTEPNWFAIRFCQEIEQNPESFSLNAQVEDLRTFLLWTLDRYPRVRASESLNNYWRVLNMHIFYQTDRSLNDSIRSVDHLLSMTLHDDVFVAESTRDVSYIFRAKPSSAKKSLTLKIKADALNQSIFREPERVVNDYRTSKKKPLRSSTWLRYLKPLGLKSDLCWDRA